MIFFLLATLNAPFLRSSPGKQIPQALIQTRKQSDYWGTSFVFVKMAQVAKNRCD